MARRFARTMEHAFDRLTLDGVQFTAMEAYAHFGNLRDKRRPDDTWQEEAFHLVRELTLLGGRSIAATTSGTTGPPKAMRIPRRDLVNSARLTALTFGLHEGDRALLCLPCAYIAGKMMLVRAMALGLDLHLIDPRGGVLGNLRSRERFRFAAMVPLQLHRAIQEDRARVEDQFHTILLGGGPVSSVLREDLKGLRTAVFQGYGSTETVTHVAVRRLNGPAPETAYRAIGQVHFSVDRRGCLVVHAPHLRIKEHRTNDRVELLDGTHFNWLGRIDNVILSGGKKIYPELLEERTAGLLPWPHFFMPFPDDRLGQMVGLVLETEQGPDEVMEVVRPVLLRVLRRHELPRRMVAMRSLLRTASGKLIRRLAP